MITTATEATTNASAATTAQNKTVQLRAKAFSGEGVKINRFLVTGSEVKSWDRTAGHYTLCHSLTTRAIGRILTVASQM